MNNVRQILLGIENSSPSYNFKRVEWVVTVAIDEMQLNITNKIMNLFFNYYQAVGTIGYYVFHIFTPNIPKYNIMYYNIKYNII